MELHQSNSTSNEEALFELLTLNCEIDDCGDTYYTNKEGHAHRIYGPAVIWVGGTRWWYRDNKLHREDGPAIIFADGSEEYFVNGVVLSKERFIQWQKKNGIKPIE